MELFDTHVHLDDQAFAADLAVVLGRARAAGVVHMINAGASRKTNAKVLALAQQHPEISAAVGLHPHEFCSAQSENASGAPSEQGANRSEDFGRKIGPQSPMEPGSDGQFTDQDRDVLRVQLSQERVVALGEIGLDFHVFSDFPAPDREAQMHAFVRQLELAKHFELPVILHVREAYPEALGALRDMKPFPAGGVMHCYSGGTEYIRDVLDLGFCVGIGGTVTYPKSQDLRAAVREIPDERLLLETDAPYLPPQKHRGQRNEPAWVSMVADAVAQIKGMSVSQLAEITTTNARRLFRLESGPAGTLAYEIAGHLYVNLTNRCSASCGFCPRRIHRRVQEHNLDLSREPDTREIIEAIGDPARYKEIVFCGYGEPTLRWPTLLQVAKAVKPSARRVRVNTNGHGELLYGTGLLAEARGWIDEWSVSLNSADARQYQRLVAPAAGAAAYPAVLAFIEHAVRAGFQVTASAVEVPEVVDEAAVQRLAETLGARYRGRGFQRLGEPEE